MRPLGLLAFYLFTFVFISCGGPSTLNSSTDAEEGGNAADPGIQSDETTGGDQLMPPISLPSPTLIKVNEEDVLITGTEDGGILVYGAQQAASQDYGNEQYRVAITARSIAIPTSPEKVIVSPLIGHLFDVLIPTARADNVKFEGHCSETGITCCSIQSDGSFECNLSVPTGTTLVSLFITDGVNVSPIIQRSVVKNVQLSAPDADTLLTPDAIQSTPYFIASDPCRPGLRSYALAPLLGVMGILDTEVGIQLCYLEGEQVVDADIVATVSQTAAYSYLRLSHDGRLRFARSTPGVMTTEFLYDALMSLPSPSGSHLPFLNNDLDEKGEPLSGQQTHLFDVEGPGGFALVLFEDGGEELRLRAAKGGLNNGIRFGGEGPLDSAFPMQATDFADLEIYRAATNITDGRALLLDWVRQRVWLLSYHYNAEDPANSSVTSTLNHSLNGIKVGQGARDIVLSTDKQSAFVLNTDSKSITWLKLFDTNGMALLPAQINSDSVELPLKDYLPIKVGLLTPLSLAYQDNPKQLVVRALLGEKAITVLVPLTSEGMQELELAPTILTNPGSEDDDEDGGKGDQPDKKIKKKKKPSPGGPPIFDGAGDPPLNIETTDIFDSDDDDGEDDDDDD